MKKNKQCNVVENDIVEEKIRLLGWYGNLGK